MNNASFEVQGNVEIQVMGGLRTGVGKCFANVMLSAKRLPTLSFCGRPNGIQMIHGFV